MKLKERMLHRIRVMGLEDTTHKTYWFWCEKYIRFCRDQAGEWVDPDKCGKAEVERWLSSMVNGREWVSKRTQNLALQSVCFLYKQVLNKPLEGVNALRAKAPETVREVVDQSELIALFRELRGVGLLASMMMYGCSGLRISDAVNIRIKDISFEREQIHIHSSKGDKSRHVAFPKSLHEMVRVQIESMRVLHADDVRQGLNGVSLPDGFGRKSPKSHLSFAWWYLFASDNYSRCPRSGNLYRHHRDKSHIGRLIKDAVARAGIDKRITAHCLRHSFATHANEMGVDIPTIQALLGHADSRTTEGYIHINKTKATGSKNPLEAILANPQYSTDVKNDQCKPTLRAFTG
jgi:integron integrase